MLYFFNLAYRVGLLISSDLATIDRLPPYLAIAARIAFSSVSSRVSPAPVPGGAGAFPPEGSSMSEAERVEPSESMTAFSMQFYNSRMLPPQLWLIRTSAASSVSPITGRLYFSACFLMNISASGIISSFLSRRAGRWRCIVFIL